MIKNLKFLLFALLTVVLCIFSSPTSARSPVATAVMTRSTPVQAGTADLLEQGRALYNAGRFREAVGVLQQAIQTYEQQQNSLQQAIALTNLALVYQQTGSLSLAQQSIDASLALLRTLNPSNHHSLSVQAQVWDVQGRLQLAEGQAEQAIASWQQAAQLYTRLNDTEHLVRNQIDQSRALQSLGLYRQAIALLTNLTPTLQTQPLSIAKVTAFRNLGDALRAIGDLEQSRQFLQASLSLAQELQPSATTASSTGVTVAQIQAATGLTQLSLGNTIRASQNWRDALSFYQQAATNGSMITRTQAQLNRLNLLMKLGEVTAARTLLPEVQQHVEQLPLSRAKVEAHINLSQTLMEGAGALSQSRSPAQFLIPDAQTRMTLAAQILSNAIQQAETLGDSRTKAYALGSLGHLYEQTQQWQSAERLTRDALQISQQNLGATDITYLWQWQLGRILKVQVTEGSRTKLEEAIAAYEAAIETLQTLRLDLISANQDEQFSFRQKVEPAYRQLIELLLETIPSSTLSLQAEQADLRVQQKLEKARSTLESLQVAEIQNFFREACADVAIQIDRVVEQTNQQIDTRAAVIYPIILPEQLHVVLKLPNQDKLLHYSTEIEQATVEATLKTLRQNLPQPETLQSIQNTSQQVYEWLIRPAETVLQNDQVSTLVFVLDGFLKNIPMSALYDGKNYLVENYSIALTPGLTLPDPKPLDRQQISVLFAGLSKAAQNFPSLPFVEKEQEGIKAEVPGVVTLDNFTADALRTKIQSTNFDVLHLATHGQFSENQDQTFILAADRQIKVSELDQILRARDRTQAEPLELLVLSACRTAEGDERAALGLAGVAVRAGARSTIASLWSVEDEVGAVLMIEFYRQLMDNPLLPKSEVLKRAQLSLLRHPNYHHPAYWAPYVLLGNWL